MSNSDLHNPRFGNTGGTPVFAPPAKSTKSGTQTKEVLEHLRQIQQQKKSGSLINNPGFLGAAMKAIYESSDVSVKRGDQTMVVTQLRGDEPTIEMPAVRRAPVAKNNPPQTDRSVPHSAGSGRSARRDPFSSRPPIERKQPPSTLGLNSSKSTASGVIDDTSIRKSSTGSITDILFWTALVMVFVGLSFWISR